MKESRHETFIGFDVPGSRKIFHFHIPKTGGTAIREYLIAQAGESQITPLLGGIRFSDALLQWDHKQVLSGHVVFHQGDEIPSDYYAMTFLRDPVDRFLSDLFYGKHQSPDQPRDARLRLADLDSYISKIQHERQDAVALQLSMLYPIGAKETDCNLGVSEKLAAAKKAIDRFDLIGIQEDLDDATCMLAAEMEWPQKTLPWANQTWKRISVSDLNTAQQKLIETVLAPEIELYEYARDRFRRDRRRHITSSTSNPSIAKEHRTADNIQTAVKPVDRRITSIKQGRKPRNFGDKRCEVTRVIAKGSVTGAPEMLCGEPILIEMEIAAHEVIENVTVGIGIRDERGALLFGTNSRLLGDAIELEPGRYVANFSMLNRLGRGQYCIDVSLIKDLSHHDGCYHWFEDAARFEIYDLVTNYFEGRFMLDPDFALSSIDDSPEPRIDRVHVEQAGVRSFGRMNPPLSQFDASIQLLSPKHALPAATDSFLQLRVKNSGLEAWSASGYCRPVCLTYRWYSQEGDLIVPDGLRSILPDDVAGGNSVIAPLLVRAPDEPGTYRLAISLVQEDVAWFIEKNAASGCLIDVEIA